MLHTIERLIILKGVSIFAEIPDEYLAELASVVEEIEVEANECIFAKDDLGSVAYIIAEGRIRIHDGEREIAVLGEREVFGELAVLDPEPRSASATALEDGLLFSIAEDKLYQLLAEHAAVANGIIRVLCQRLRS